MRRRQEEQLTKRTASGQAPRMFTHGQLRELRRELNALVAAMHHRTGKLHGMIHNELRQIAAARRWRRPTAINCRPASKRCGP